MASSFFPFLRLLLAFRLRKKSLPADIFRVAKAGKLWYNTPRFADIVHR